MENPLILFEFLPSETNERRPACILIWYLSIWSLMLIASWQKAINGLRACIFLNIYGHSIKALKIINKLEK